VGWVYVLIGVLVVAAGLVAWRVPRARVAALSAGGALLALLLALLGVRQLQRRAGRRRGARNEQWQAREDSRTSTEDHNQQVHEHRQDSEFLIGDNLEAPDEDRIITVVDRANDQIDGGSL